MVCEIRKHFIVYVRTCLVPLSLFFGSVPLFFTPSGAVRQQGALRRARALHAEEPSQLDPHMPGASFRVHCGSAASRVTRYCAMRTGYAAAALAIRKCQLCLVGQRVRSSTHQRKQALRHRGQ